jgi:hypothetical protein
MPQVFNFAVQVWDSEKEYENFGDEPIKFKTKADMRRLCRERGWNCAAL